MNIFRLFIFRCRYSSCGQLHHEIGIKKTIVDFLQFFSTFRQWICCMCLENNLSTIYIFSYCESTEERKKWTDYFLKTSLPRLVRISFQFQEPTEMIKKFLTTQKFSLLTVCTLPWQDKINRLDGTAASAVCCIMHKKQKGEKICRMKYLN